MSPGRTFLAAALAAVLGCGASVLSGAPSAFAADTTFADSTINGVPANLVPYRGPAGTWRIGESAVAVLFGVGWYDNGDFNADLVANGIEPIENGFEYGIQYRHRISRWISFGAELVHFDGRTNTTDGSNIEYGISATPFMVDGFVHPYQEKNVSLALFGGVGPLIAAKLSQVFPNGAEMSGIKTGFIVQGGGEGELRFGPNFGFFLRGLVRRASVKDVIVDQGIGLPPIRYDIDFNGLGVTFGPRWYFGGEDRPEALEPPPPGEE